MTDPKSAETEGAAPDANKTKSAPPDAVAAAAPQLPDEMIEGDVVIEGAAEAAVPADARVREIRARLVADGAAALLPYVYDPREIPAIRVFHEHASTDIVWLLDRLAAAREEIAIDDELIADRDRVLDALPCPDHGRCVPYALERIAVLKSAETEPQARPTETPNDRPAAPLAGPADPVDAEIATLEKIAAITDDDTRSDLAALSIIAAMCRLRLSELVRAGSAGTERASATPPKETCVVADPEALRGALERMIEAADHSLKMGRLTAALSSETAFARDALARASSPGARQADADASGEVK